MKETTHTYLGATFYVSQDEDGYWNGYYPGPGRIGLIAESEEEAIERIKEHLDRWGLPEFPEKS